LSILEILTILPESFHTDASICIKHML